MVAQARIYASFLAVHLQECRRRLDVPRSVPKITAATAAGRCRVEDGPELRDTSGPGSDAQRRRKTTLFTGEMLRATLLDSWGWKTLGLYTTYAGIGSSRIAAARVRSGPWPSELLVAVRKPETSKVKVGQRGQRRSTAHKSDGKPRRASGPPDLSCRPPMSETDALGGPAS